MTGEEVQAYVFTGSFLFAFLLGVRASWRLTRRYRQVAPVVEPRNRPILFVIVVAAWIITAAAGWIGGLSIIRILTSVVIPWTPPITLLVAIAVVFIPVMFDVTITRLVEGDDEPLVNRTIRHVLELQTGRIPAPDEEPDEAPTEPARPTVGVTVDVSVDLEGKETNA